MSKRARLLSEIYDMSTNPQEVIIFTSAFKAKGTFLRDDSQRKEGVITLKMQLFVIISMTVHVVILFVTIMNAKRVFNVIIG